jgi:hypothetical protein
VNPLAIATPEPSLSVFLGVSLAGLAFFRRRNTARSLRYR